jgi:hypothetical protein
MFPYFSAVNRNETRAGPLTPPSIGSLQEPALDLIAFIFDYLNSTD